MSARSLGFLQNPGDPPLTARGLKQAHQLGLRLKVILFECSALLWTRKSISIVVHLKSNREITCFAEIVYALHAHVKTPENMLRPKSPIGMSLLSMNGHLTVLRLEFAQSSQLVNLLWDCRKKTLDTSTLAPS